MFNKLYPDYYFESIDQITHELLKENKIYGIILDIDDTTIGFRSKTPSDIALNWIKTMRDNNIKFCIVSNNSLKRVKILLEYFDFPSIHGALKPFKRSFGIAAKKLDLKSENIAVVGDQIFTDIWGANNSGMTSILVNPVDTRKDVFFKMKRFLESYVIKRYVNGKKGAGQ